MRKYPKYKASGVDWVKILPETWGELRVKYFSVFRNGYSFKGTDFFEDEKYPVVRIGDIQEGNVNLESATKVSQKVYEEAKKFTNKRGDILLALTGATIGKSAIYDTDEISLLNQRVAALRPNKKANIDFLKYLIEAPEFKTLIDFECYGGAQENIGKGQITSAKFPIPSLSEQLSIVRFLDHKIGQIDRFIANRQKQIELLKEQKAAIINKAVTGKIPMSELGLKGLKDDRIENTNASENQILPSSNPKNQNSDRKMKPSGIEWLPEIPETWKVMELKFAAKMMRGKFSHRPRNDERLYGGKFPFIQTGDVTKTEKYITSYKQTLNDWGFSVSKLFPKGTVVITIAANIGDIAILDFDACFPDSIVGFFSKQNKTEYLFYLLKSMKEVFLSESIEGTQLNLSVDRLSSIKVAIPTPSEQQEIIDFILLETSNTDTLISKYQKQIDLMHEYRTSLISQAVTGKIDVRENVEEKCLN